MLLFVINKKNKVERASKADRHSARNHLLKNLDKSRTQLMILKFFLVLQILRHTQAEENNSIQRNNWIKYWLFFPIQSLIKIIRNSKVKSLDARLLKIC